MMKKPVIPNIDGERIGWDFLILTQINEIRQLGNLVGVRKEFIPAFVNAVNMLEVLSRKYLAVSPRSQRKLEKLEDELKRKTKRLINDFGNKASGQVELLHYEYARKKLIVLIDALTSKIEGVDTVDEVV